MVPAVPETQGPVEHTKLEHDEEKEPIQCTDLSETGDESIMVPAVPQRQGPVEHTKLPPLQRFSKPVQCTEPSSAPLVQSTDSAPLPMSKRIVE
ncbi:hypothetical protein OS493_026906 [Desmophyllum pertusum]|uniref:Uncharacterized protein n=1 Tax=Desmophyllum pertusum TaxID=174260 RepID=A0A9W9ZAI8_9CNID|nr:hypothetical protein OS493_026906 [Desmophyllum pertusum]